jgi:hypothetical protein
MALSTLQTFDGNPPDPHGPSSCQRRLKQGAIERVVLRGPLHGDLRRGDQARGIRGTDTRWCLTASLLSWTAGPRGWRRRGTPGDAVEEVHDTAGCVQRVTTLEYGRSGEVVASRDCVGAATHLYGMPVAVVGHQHRSRTGAVMRTVGDVDEEVFNTSITTRALILARATSSRQVCNG